MIRIREILDPELRAKVRAALADRRGLSPAGVPDWFGLDDADFVDLLNDIQAAEAGASDDDDAFEHDSRM